MPEQLRGANGWTWVRPDGMALPKKDKSEWVSVKDRTPDDHEPVFVYSLEIGRAIASYTTSGKWLGDNGYYVNDVTRWRPLPELPEEEA